VKFHSSDGFIGDISISNKLALYNTQMLATYVRFDDRLAKLGFYVKSWARKLGLNDNSTGTFSSYALVVMIIYFLQRCNPPILPFLQEDAKRNGKKPIEIEGWEVLFTEDIDHLKLNWPKNKSSVGQLFQSFLSFYIDSDLFNPAVDLIQIRTSECLQKSQWRYHPIGIEDPFDLNHNLTAGVLRDNLNRWRAAVKWTLDELRSLNRYLLDEGLEELPERMNAKSLLDHIVDAISSREREKRIEAAKYVSSRIDPETKENLVNRERIYGPRKEHLVNGSESESHMTTFNFKTLKKNI